MTALSAAGCHKRRHNYNSLLDADLSQDFGIVQIRGNRVGALPSFFAAFCASPLHFGQQRDTLIARHERIETKRRQECTRLVLAREQKKSLIDQYGTHATDTGSPEVQIALLSERIGQLTEHFKTHQKDHGSRLRTLPSVVSRDDGRAHERENDPVVARDSNTMMTEVSGARAAAAKTAAIPTSA